MKTLATLCACLAFAGCSTTGKLDNLLLVSLTGDRAFVASLYGPLGITAELRAADARELMAMREKAAVVDMLGNAAQGRP